jgi:hypothetical protein
MGVLDDARHYGIAGLLSRSKRAAIETREETS